MSANLPRSKSFGPVRFIRTEDGLGVSAGVGRVRFNRTPSGLITRTVHRPGSVVDTTQVLNSRRHPVAADSQDAPPETRRAAAERRRGGAAHVAGQGEGAAHDLRNGCLGCGGLLLLAVLVIVGLASCLGGTGGLSFSDSPSAPMVPTTVAPPTTSRGPDESSAGDATSSSSLGVPPGMVNVPSPSPSAPATTKPTAPSASSTFRPRATTRPRPTSSRPAPAPSTTAAPTRRAPSPTARPTSKPPRRPAPSPTRTVPRPTFCYPTTEYGGCYHVGDYCPEVYQGLTGVDTYGRRITCMPVDDFGIWM